MAIWKRCHKRNNVQLALFIFLIHHKVNFHFMVRFNSLKYDLISGELNKYFATNSFNSLDSGTIWTEAHQAPLSVGFHRQEYWRGLPWPPSGDLPDPGIELVSPVTAALAGGFFTTSTNWEDLLVAPLPIPCILKGIQHKDYSSLAGCLRPYIFTSASQPAFQATFRILFILYISPFLTHEQTIHTEFTS